MKIENYVWIVRAPAEPSPVVLTESSFSERSSKTLFISRKRSHECVISVSLSSDGMSFIATVFQTYALFRFPDKGSNYNIVIPYENYNYISTIKMIDSIKGEIKEQRGVDI